MCRCPACRGTRKLLDYSSGKLIETKCIFCEDGEVSKEKYDELVEIFVKEYLDLNGLD